MHNKQGGQMNMQGGMPQPPMQGGPNQQQMNMQQQQPGAPQQIQMSQMPEIQLPQIDINKLKELTGNP